jgi:MtaA/CmuA family methyltransferase
MTPLEYFETLLAGDPIDRLLVQPITMMFAARTAGVRYRDYVTDFRQLVAAQLRTAEEFGFDIVTVCSDPCGEAADLGAAIRWFDNQPPTPEPTQPLLRDRRDLLNLKVPDPSKGRMGNRVAALDLFKQRVGGELPILGWVEGPIAEGADLRGPQNMLLDLVDDPAFVADLFSFITDLELAFARAQVSAGATAIGIGDAIASQISGAMYLEHVLPYEKRLIDGIHALGVPVRLHICGRIDQLLHGISTLGADVIDIDSLTDMGIVRAKVGPKPILLGNIDPVRVLLAGPPAHIQKEIARCHEKSGTRFIVGAGCEIPPATPRDHALALRAYADHAATSDEMVNQ